MTPSYQSGCQYLHFQLEGEIKLSSIVKKRKRERKKTP